MGAAGTKWRRAGGPAARPQGGATLLEVLIVVAIAVPIIIAAAVGLQITVRLSGATEQTQKAEAQLTAYAESLKQVPYVPCAEPSDYDGDPGLWSPPVGSKPNLDLEVVGVRHWSQASRDYSAPLCTVAGDDGGAQLVTVRASTSERSWELDVVKRNPDASAGGAP